MEDEVERGALKLIEKLKTTATSLRRELIVLYLAARDPRTPWYAKTVVACVVAYTLSPIDLIPDFVPVLGYVDDLLLLPLGIYLALKMIPQQVLTESRQRAALTSDRLSKNWVAAAVIILLWTAGIFFLGLYLLRIFCS
jgi:uncharacterized membrane protein YkvA (DUF1232 family)